MAQVQEVSKKGLKHEFAITVPQQVVEKHWLARLEQAGKEARIPGFRPGKIPMNVLKQRFGANARAEALDQTVAEVSEKTLTERKLRPAMQPQIELVAFAEGKDLEFKMAVEVLPEVVPADFTKIALEKPVAEVEAKTIDEAITRAAKAMREPEIVTEARGAKMGDVLIIDFDGKVGGEARPGMQGKAHKLELGSKSFIDNFEEQLVGCKAGDKKTIKVTFPEEYHAADLSGKKAEFAVEVKELRAHKAAELNDELAKELGFPSMEKLRERVKEDIDASYKRVSRAVAKRKLMDKLAEAHSFEIPAGMLEAEFGSIWQQVEESKKRGDLPEEDKKKSDDQLRKEYRAIAERRIRLGLLLAEVAQKQNITVAPAELRNALMAEARRFPGQEKAVIDYYTQTQGAMERLRAPLLEEKVIDHILSQAKVTEKKISAEELAKLPDEDEG
jgi:trigger factor